MCEFNRFLHENVSCQIANMRLLYKFDVHSKYTATIDAIIICFSLYIFAVKVASYYTANPMRIQLSSHNIIRAKSAPFYVFSILYTIDIM